MKPRRRRFLAVVVAALVTSAVLPRPAAAVPVSPGRPLAPAGALPRPAAVTAAAAGEAPVATTRARAATLRRRLRELADRSERLAVAADAVQARADLLVAGAAVRRRELDDAERTLADAEDRYGQQVRDLYMRGPLAPFEPLLYATDPAALALAGRVAAETLRGGQRDLLVVEVARGRVELALAELDRDQAGLRREQERLAARRTALAAGLAAAQALLDSADAEVRRAVAGERRRREAAHRAAVEAALARAGARSAVHSGLRCALDGTSAAERLVIEHESSGDPGAANPVSTAFGLGQLLLDQRLRYLGADYATTDCARQLAAFRAYVRDRYGTAEAAMAFWLAHHWY